MYLVNDIIALLAANLILMQALGTSTLFIAAGSRKNLIATALCITVFTTIGSAAAYVIDSSLPVEYDYFKLLIYTLTVSVMYVSMLTALFFTARENFERYRKYDDLPCRRF